MEEAKTTLHTVERHEKARGRSFVQAVEREGKTSRRTLFAAIDAVTIGGMVAIGVFCRRSGIKGGRWTGIAGSSAFLELAKAVRKAIQR